MSNLLRDRADPRQVRRDLQAGHLKKGRAVLFPAPPEDIGNPSSTDLTLLQTSQNQADRVWFNYFECVTAYFELMGHDDLDLIVINPAPEYRYFYAPALQG